MPVTSVDHNSLYAVPNYGGLDQQTVIVGWPLQGYSSTSPIFSWLGQDLVDNVISSAPAPTITWVNPETVDIQQSENYTLTDTPSVVVVITITESITYTEGNAVPAAAVPQTDTITFSDSFVGARSVVPTDTITFTDTVTKTVVSRNRPTKTITSVESRIDIAR